MRMRVRLSGQSMAIGMETRAHAAAARRLTKLDLADRDSDTGRKAAAPPMGPRLVSIYIISPTTSFTRGAPRLHKIYDTSGRPRRYKPVTARAARYGEEGNLHTRLRCEFWILNSCDSDSKGRTLPFAGGAS